jgi:hypothetical protein
MSLRAFSWWSNSSKARKNPKASVAAARSNRWTARRTLRLERLEDRQLLSIGLGTTVPAAKLVGPPVPGQYAPAAAGDVITYGPAITGVVVAAAQALITWNAASSAGVVSCTLMVDGMPATHVGGPYTAPSGGNYSWSFNSLPCGNHTFTITATDTNAASSQYSGTFVVGPVISKVVASGAQGLITWNVAAAVGVNSSSLAIDGATVSNVYGPYTAPPGLNYGWAYGSYAAGQHTFTITATDTWGKLSQYTGSFSISPVINKVVSSEAAGAITWNVAASVGVASSTIAVDGATMSTVYGPYKAPPGVNYAWAFGGVRSGQHTFTIMATDMAGRTAQYTDTFNVPGPAITQVAVSETQGVITWNAAAGCGVAKSAIAIDGTTMGNVEGPWEAPPGLNYACPFGALGSGNHTFVITATDAYGTASQYTGSFLVGPTISKVTVAATQKLITWNVSAALGVASATLSVDGYGVSNVAGPWLAPPGLNYAWAYGGLSAGNHTFVITATDTNGNSSQYTGYLFA